MHSLQVIYLKWPVIFILCSMLKKESDPFNNANGQGVCQWGRGGTKGIKPPNIVEIARKLVDIQPCHKRSGHSIFRDLIIVTIVGKMVQTSPPKWKVLRCISDNSVSRIYRLYVPVRTPTCARTNLTLLDTKTKVINRLGSASVAIN